LHANHPNYRGQLIGEDVFCLFVQSICPSVEYFNVAEVTPALRPRSQELTDGLLNEGGTITVLTAQLIDFL
jgi:hypothetical protein